MNRWFGVWLGVILGAGLHTLVVLWSDMAPRANDTFFAWLTFFAMLTAIPMGVTLVAGGILAASAQTRRLGVGLAAGAVASPVAWVLASLSIT